MAKLWGVSGCARAVQQKKDFSNATHTSIASDIRRENRVPKPGIKSNVMMVYIEKGKLAAWHALQEYNKKISGEGFTLEMLEQWIGEYEKRKAQRVGKDDGYDR